LAEYLTHPSSELVMIITCRYENVQVGFRLAKDHDNEIR